MPDTLLQMRTRVKFKVGSKDNIDATIDENINEAILQLLQEVRPQETWQNITFNTSNATAEYTFATIFGMATPDLLAVVMVRNNTDDLEIKRGSPRHFNLLRQTTTLASNLGRPNRWTRIRNSIILYNKIPDSTTRAIKVHYIERPDRMVLTTDTFPLNDEWKRPVEELAAALTFNDLNKFDKAQAKLTTYREMLGFRQRPQDMEREAPESQFVPVSNLAD